MCVCVLCVLFLITSIGDVNESSSSLSPQCPVWLLLFSSSLSTSSSLLLLLLFLRLLFLLPTSLGLFDVILYESTARKCEHFFIYPTWP